MNSQDMTVIASSDLNALRTAICRIGEALRTMEREDTEELLRSVLFDAALRNQDAAMDVLERIDEGEPSAAT